MKVLSLLLTLCALPRALSQATDSATVYIQPLSSTSPPFPLADIKYNPSTLSASLDAFHLPDIPISSSSLVRVGIYDIATATWKSSTSMTSTESFAKGFRPTLVLSLDAQGGVLGVTCKSSRVSAGSTKDFGPGVVVKKMVKGVGPSLNRYV
jgi:hypothetical protein